MALAVNVNPDGFSGSDGEEVRIKRLVGRVGGDNVEGLIGSVKVGGISVDTGLRISSGPKGINMSNGMFRYGNDSVELIPTVQNMTSGEAEKKRSIGVVGRMKTHNQGTYGAGCHRDVGFLGDMHVFTKRKLTMILLNQCPSNECTQSVSQQ
jgi:hypothetical protein